MFNDDFDYITPDYDNEYEVEKPRTFNHKGNIWHHLEFSNPFDYWYRTPDGIKKTIRIVLERIEIYEYGDLDLEKALNYIQSGRYADVEDRLGIYT